MAKIFEKVIFGGLHEKHAVQRGIWVPTQHLLWDQGKPRKTLIELAGWSSQNSKSRAFTLVLLITYLHRPHSKHFATVLLLHHVAVLRTL
jgi:hypothetical protein